ncbi:MAG TPA: EAL domain-containing protein [Thiotrichales bacterium]|nr:EAL domain-containing protein [Thiotrichales bacterium]
MTLRLATRLIFGVIAIEVVMLSLLVWNSVRLISNSNGELLQDQVHEENSLLAAALAPGLAARDPAQVLDVLSLLQGRDSLVYVQVLDAQGREVAMIGEVPAPRGGRRGMPPPDYGYRQALADGCFDTVREVVLAGQGVGSVRVGYSVEKMRAAATEVRFQSSLIAGAEILFSVLLSILLGLFLTRNLRRLEEGAQLLMAGRFDHRIDIEGNDEIGRVAASWNRLAEHLQVTREALHQEQQALQRETRHLHTLLDGIDAVVMEMAPEQERFTYVSLEAENLLGRSLTEWGEPGFLRRVIHPEDEGPVMERLLAAGESDDSFTLDFRLIHANGHPLWVRTICSAERLEGGGTVLRGLIMDITQQKISEEHIIYLADHDALTGLYNRRRFQEELEHHLAYGERFGHDSALLFIDLDQFKYINDTLGHPAGDEYLVTVASTLQTRLRDVDVLGRLGGDEFGVILPRTTEEEAERVAEELLETLRRQPMIGGGRTLHVSASIGIVLFPAHGSSAGELLAFADAAMYEAKEAGRNRWAVFREEGGSLSSMRQRVHWEGRIRHALERDQFELHYQPVRRLADGSVLHYEALLRMRDPVRNETISPGAFMDTAERFGLIRDIDLWVVEEAIAGIGAMARAGQPLAVAVNLSGRNFGDDRFLEHIRGCLSRYGADPGQLIIEVTETAAVANLAQAQRFLRALRALGCRFALDDFGVGFASMHYLKHLPVDYVKIDGGFVRALDSDSVDRVFVRAINEMARGLSIEAIAEFVESEAVCGVLQEIGVPLGQGYHLGRPQPGLASHELPPCGLTGG